jgi:hypothetical protein
MYDGSKNKCIMIQRASVVVLPVGEKECVVHFCCGDAWISGYALLERKVAAPNQGEAKK